MTAWTYTTLVAALDNYLQQDPTQPGTTQFASAIPTIIGNAEQMIYRELDFLATRNQVAQGTFTAGSRKLSLASIVSPGYYPQYPIVVQGIAAILPSSAAAPASGTRIQYELASLDFIDMAWPTEANTAPPTEGFAYFAMSSDQNVVVAPTPDAAYLVEVTGTFRPAAMATANQTTWLGNNLPDLLFHACMVQATGYLRDYGASSDDPRFAISWKAMYDASKTSAMAEESRRKGEGVGWTPYSVSTLAQPPHM